MKQTVCKVSKIFQCGKYLVAYVLKEAAISLRHLGKSIEGNLYTCI